LAKILTKLNYCYERYIIFHIDNNDKNNKKYQDNTKNVKSDKLDNEKKEILPINNNSDDNNEDKDSTNINNSHIPCINSTSYINSELYCLVRNFKNINHNLEIINIIGD
jgi:hypothetical protein